MKHYCHKHVNKVPVCFICQMNIIISESWPLNPWIPSTSKTAILEKSEVFLFGCPVFNDPVHQIYFG